MGISGLEAYYEHTLMGRRGVQYKMVNVRGIEKGAFRDGEFDTLSVAGQDLHLSIDAELQAYGEKLLAGRRGSIVAIDPKTGEILCLRVGPALRARKPSPARAWATATWTLLQQPRPAAVRPAR
ncbi:MAG: hypothetical protein WKG07_20680 [Hymenobacter sp.]